MKIALKTTSAPAIFFSLKHQLLVYLFALGIIIGSAYTMYVHFDFSHSTDSKSYIKMAQGDFDVTITHRYRVLVPFAAAAVAWPMQQVYKKIWPHRAASDWPLRIGFFVINSLLVAWFGLLLYLICRNYGASGWSSLVAVTAVLTSRWAVYSAGLPLIDSLFLVTVALAFYGIKAEKKWALVLAILLGPLAKESFIFFAPIIFFYGRALPKLQQVLLFVLAGALAFFIRFTIDAQVQATADAGGLQNAFEHVENIILSIKRIFSVKGIGELFSVFGVFTLVLIAGFFGGKAQRQQWLGQLDVVCLWWMLAVAVQVLLSHDVGRMTYLTAPVFAASVALILDRHSFWQSFRNKIAPHFNQQH
ncbi:MAG: hypothetical protein LPK19_07130 [Hymenobacteraceae bacterium]|nr:hypothetical protein [Hymenobacteraceae bacterium]MDX5395976.1 hypothetical protein [Hymenobacteraceae bacterium]MDX5512037.1 hypothetical protein [Hymenobacteraceae bacterium]